jgi:hypothetical protein
MADEKQLQDLLAEIEKRRRREEEMEEEAGNLITTVQELAVRLKVLGAAPKNAALVLSEANKAGGKG